MLFRPALLIVAIASLAQTAFSALNATQVADSINQVANVSSSANTALSALTTNPSLSQAKTISKNLVTSFTTIVTSLGNDVTTFESARATAFSDIDATIIVNALNEFIAIHQLFLGTVIGKHSIFAQFALTAPISTVLDKLEAIVDSFAEALIALIPTKASSAQDSFNSLDATVAQSLKTYQQVCVPSLFYPEVPPKCFNI